MADEQVDHLLPPSLKVGDEIEITWQETKKGTKVKAVLCGAQIVVRTTPESAQIVPWLVATLPNILNQAWDGIQADREETQ